jgi:hypothetical protein
MTMQIQVGSTDDIRQFLAGLASESDRRQLNAGIGMSATAAVRKNFRALAVKPNRFNAPHTGYYRDAAESTDYEVDGDNITIRIRQTGIWHRYHGKTIRAKNKKAMTIPLIAAAYDRSVKEYEREHGVELIRPKKSDGTPANVLIRKAAHGNEDFEPVYALVRAVHLKPEPHLVPSDQEILKAAEDVVQDWIDMKGGQS